MININDSYFYKNKFIYHTLRSDVSFLHLIPWDFPIPVIKYKQIKSSIDIFLKVSKSTTGLKLIIIKMLEQTKF